MFTSTNNPLSRYFAPDDIDRDELLQHMVWSYFGLRRAIYITAFLAPVIYLLASVPLVTNLIPMDVSPIELKRSISIYFHDDAFKPFFIGSLLFVSILLFVYKGHTKKEDWLLNSASLFLLCVILFPTEPPGTDPRAVLHPHIAFAVAFFLMIAFVCWKTAADTLPYLDEKYEKRFRFIYKWLGWIMIALPVASGALNIMTNTGKAVFWVEFAAIWVFGVYWLVKSIELRYSSLEETTLQPA